MSITAIPADVWRIIVNDYLKDDLRTVIALSLTSHACRLAAHTLKLTKCGYGDFSCSMECTRLIQNGAWPHLSLNCAICDDDEMVDLKFVDEFIVPRKMRFILFGQRHLDNVCALSSLTSLCLWGDGEEFYNININIPQSIVKLTHLSKLEIINCTFKLPDNFCELSSLTHFYVSWCSYVEQTFPKFPDLLFFEMRYSECGLSGFDDISTLKSISLQGSPEYFEMPNDISALKDLQELNLDACHVLQNMSPNIGQLSSLTYLNLRNCKSLKVLPESIGQLTTLITLELSKSGVQSFPRSIAGMTSLETLNAHQSDLTFVPREVGSLPSLKHLDLSKNILDEIEQGLGHLTALVRLDLTGSVIHALSPDVSMMYQLVNHDFTVMDDAEEYEEFCDQNEFFTDADDYDTNERRFCE